MASKDPFCSRCESLKTTTGAVAWCSSCNDTLCQKCFEQHDITESSYNHNVMTIEEYGRLPAFVQSIKLFCSLHCQKYEAFCCTHGHPLCKKCIESNKDCGDIKPLSDIVDNAKSSVAFEWLNDGLNDLTLNIQKIKEDQKSNLRNICEQRFTIKSEISKIREANLKHLAAIEDELSVVADDASNRIKNILTELNAKEKELLRMRESVTLINENASNFQTYFATKEMEDFVSRADQYLDSVLLHGNSSLKLNMEKTLESLSTNVSEFGRIARLAVPSSVKIVRSQDKRAQITRPSNELNVNLIPRLTIKIGRNLARRSRNVTGCCITPNMNARYIFAEYVNTQLIFHDKDGNCTKISTVNGFPAFDVALIDNQHVAVTSGSDRKIQIVKLAEHQICKEMIETSGNCYGITTHKGQLLCCVEGRGIELIGIENKTTCRPTCRRFVINDNGISMGSYITSNNCRICISNKNSNSVAVFNSDFTKLWEYQFEYNPESPRGVAIDMNNRVYVAGNFTNNVVLLSSDGTKMTEELNYSDGLDQPCGICYDRDQDCIMVANMTGTAIMYDVVRRILSP